MERTDKEDLSMEGMDVGNGVAKDEESAINCQQHNKIEIGLRVSELTKDKRPKNFSNTIEHKCICDIKILVAYPILLGHRCPLIPLLIVGVTMATAYK